jgi:predicted glycogen debranching enzyme
MLVEGDPITRPRSYTVIKLETSICNDLSQASTREWLETNGIGGFASATVTGMNTRRYHGILVAATKPPVGRMMLVSKLEETLIISGRRIDLATNRYGDVVHPRGFEYVVGFRLDPWPIYTFDVEGLLIEKSVFMIHGENATLVSYRVIKAPMGFDTAQLEVRPLVAARDYHSTTHENAAISSQYESANGLVSFSPYQGVPTIYFAHSALDLEPQNQWYRNFLYQVEQERGLDCVEDLYNPFVFRFDLRKKMSADIIVSTMPREVSDAETLRQSEVKRRAAIVSAAPVKDDFVGQLALAADQFIAKRDDGYTVLAGYPWFTDWGRDTMIALPGLTLFTGNAEIAKGILRTFAQHVDRGMLPNRFPDVGEEPEFNTVDATLWYFEAVRAYLGATADYNFVRQELYPVLQSIIDWHVRGTRYGIKMQDNGMLNAGEPGVQLTWMDSKIGDWVVTPRTGKPVEIQALWYNALRIMEDLATHFDDQLGQKRYRTMAALTHWTFNRIFWNEEAGCLYDVTNGGPPDPSIRPNQIIAVSLTHSMLPSDRAAAVVDVVERELLTPYGLRSLSPVDPRFAARYEGNSSKRDSVYHQGTVWPWLIGPFVTAYVKVNGKSDAVRQRALEFLRPLHVHLSEAGLGQISEITDATPPFTPRGCFAQAWSVAEILRALCEDVYQVGQRGAVSKSNIAEIATA